ncbi:MAG: hypothetical protein Q8O84_04200 [Nanoarchaeota archaeon]|nr:hypothetical protein [Nanoarchaeota archaeon]
MTKKIINRTKRSPTQRYSLNYPRILSAGKRCPVGTRKSSTGKTCRRKKK